LFVFLSEYKYTNITKSNWKRKRITISD